MEDYKLIYEINRVRGGIRSMAENLSSDLSLSLPRYIESMQESTIATLHSKSLFTNACCLFSLKYSLINDWH